MRKFDFGLEKGKILVENLEFALRETMKCSYIDIIKTETFTNRIWFCKGAPPIETTINKTADRVVVELETI